MSSRAIIGRHPISGEVGAWISKPGYDCRTDDRGDRNKFLLSTNFAGRKPFRLIRAGIINSNTPIYLPSSLVNLGGEPMLTYRIMTNGTTERYNAFYGAENDGAGGGYSGTEFINRLVDSDPAYFLIQLNGAPTNTSFQLRYMVALF